MSHLRDLNQKPSFWDWVSDMGGAPPDQPWPQTGGDHDGKNKETKNKAAASRDAGEGPSNTYPDEKKHMLDDEMEVNVAPPEYDGEDPPTPPEEYPEDPFAFNEKLPDRSVHPFHEGDGPDEDAPPRDGPCRRGRGGGCRRGGGGPRHHGGPHHPHGHHHGGPGAHGGWGADRRGRGGWGGWGRRGRGGPPGMFGGGAGPFGPGFPFGPGGFPGMMGADGARGGAGWAEMAKKFAERLGLDPSQVNKGAAHLEEGVDFEPAIDVYATPTHYVVHLALPGAKKEDVAVTWDESQAALTVSGVVTRGVDEAMTNQLALGERPIGFFKRVVRLGDREHPARVDADTIAAKMDEGVLKITVGKTDDFVEVKKVPVD